MAKRSSKGQIERSKPIHSGNQLKIRYFSPIFFVIGFGIYPFKAYNKGVRSNKVKLERGNL